MKSDQAYPPVVGIAVTRATGTGFYQRGGRKTAAGGTGLIQKSTPIQPGHDLIG